MYIFCLCIIFIFPGSFPDGIMSMNDVTFKYAKDCEDTEVDNGRNLREVPPDRYSLDDCCSMYLQGKFNLEVTPTPPKVDASSSFTKRAKGEDANTKDKKKSDNTPTKGGKDDQLLLKANNVHDTSSGIQTRSKKTTSTQ